MILGLVIVVVVVAVSVAVAIDGWRYSDGDYEDELAKRWQAERRERRIHLGLPLDDERRER